MQIMKKSRLTLILLFTTFCVVAQNESAFEKGEWFKFKMSYSGWMKAGEATLEVQEDTINDRPVFHVVGNGKTKSNQVN